RGGFWRHFLVKYPEVNTLYRLALRAGAKIHAMAPGAQQTQALEELWAGEGNCPYWHGVFGGVYLPHIRGAAFSHLIAAEALADAAARDPGPYALGEAADLDGDGHTEVRLATDVLALTVDPGRGGSLVEWDYRPVPRHLGNVLTRRREAYHADLLNAAAAGTLRGAAAEGVESIHTSAVRVKHPGLERHLVYDRTRRPDAMGGDRPAPGDPGRGVGAGRVRLAGRRLGRSRGAPRPPPRARHAPGGSPRDGHGRVVGIGAHLRPVHPRGGLVLSDFHDLQF